jgi:anti-sigma-K factor RskA
MRRSRLESLLHDYVAGDLDGDARRDIEQRLEREPDMRALLEEVRSAHEALQTLRARAEPPVPLEHIQAAIAAHNFDSKPALHLRSEGTRFYRRLAMAATLLFAVTAGLFTYNRFSRPAPEQPGPIHVERLTAEERGLERFVEIGGRRNGITGEELFRRLAEIEKDPRELRVTPSYNVVPIAFESR